MSATRRRQVFDLVLAGGLASLGVLEVLVPYSSRQGTGSAATTAVVVVLVNAGLVLRRRAPLAAATVALLTWPLVFSFTDVYVLFWGQFVPLGVALFTVSRHGRGREPYAGAALAAVALLYFDLRVPVLQSLSEIVFHWTVMTLVWSSGRALAVAERRARLHLQRAVEAEVSAAEAVMSAVVEERTRIARELHDVVAHAVSSMVVQAGAAEQVVEDDPAYARAALGSIRGTGAEALEEMRRVVAILRQDGEGGSLTPQPGVAMIPALVAEARSAGLEVGWSTEGTVVPLPPGLDLAVYRIVQEALTNVRRHAGASRAEVHLRFGPDEVAVEVRDDGPGPVVTGRPGHGLVGMQERAALYGGCVRTGPEKGHGFVVRAALPLVAR